MKVYIVFNDINLSCMADKVFLNEKGAEDYCNYSDQWIEEHEVIE